MPTGNKTPGNPQKYLTVDRRNVLLSSASVLALAATGLTTAMAQAPKPSTTRHSLAGASQISSSSGATTSATGTSAPIIRA